MDVSIKLNNFEIVPSEAHTRRELRALCGMESLQILASNLPTPTVLSIMYVIVLAFIFLSYIVRDTSPDVSQYLKYSEEFGDSQIENPNEISLYPKVAPPLLAAANKLSKLLKVLIFSIKLCILLSFTVHASWADTQIIESN